MNLRKKFEDFKDWCPQPPSRLRIKLKSYTVPVAIVCAAALLASSFFIWSIPHIPDQPITQLPIVQTTTSNSSQPTPLPKTTTAALATPTGPLITAATLSSGNPIISINQFPGMYHLSLNQGSTSILVTSANLTTGTYPYDTRYYSGSSNNGTIAVENGEPCLVITVTLRNDYSTQNPPPNQFTGNPTMAQVVLTAEIFDGTTQINSTDLSRVAVPGTGGSYIFLNGDETGTVTIYLATTSQDEVTGFQIIPLYIGGIPLA